MPSRVRRARRDQIDNVAKKTSAGICARRRWAMGGIREAAPKGRLWESLDRPGGVPRRLPPQRFSCWRAVWMPPAITAIPVRVPASRASPSAGPTEGPPTRDACRKRRGYGGGYVQEGFDQQVVAETRRDAEAAHQQGVARRRHEPAGLPCQSRHNRPLEPGGWPAGLNGPPPCVGQIGQLSRPRASDNVPRAVRKPGSTAPDAWTKRHGRRKAA